MLQKNVISVIEEKVGTAHSPLKNISEDFMFQLTKSKLDNLKSQSVISS